ncbi:MAG: PaaI family thioesterase [Pseudomonadota bacterium]
MNDTNDISLHSAQQHYTKIFAPWIQDLNITIDHIDNENVVMTLPYDDKLCRVGGIICGQALMALIDTCMVYVCFIGHKKFIDCATVNQNTSFLRPAINTPVTATGRVVKSGRTLVFGEVLLQDQNAKSICNATLTYAVMPS